MSTQQMREIQQARQLPKPAARRTIAYIFLEAKREYREANRKK